MLGYIFHTDSYYLIYNGEFKMSEKVLKSIFVLLFAIRSVVAGAQPALLMTQYVPERC